MGLSRESIYDELDGEEVKKILLTRMQDLLETVPDFHKHLTLPRVHMHLKVHLDIWGRRNPSLDLETDLTLTLRHPVGEITMAKELEAEEFVNADTGIPVPNTPFQGDGVPPDEIREEHGLPLMEPIKEHPGLTLQRPVMPPAVERDWEIQSVTPAPAPVTVNAKEMPVRGPGGRRWGGFHTLERAGPVVSGNLEYLDGSAPIVKTPSTDRDKPDIGIKQDFRDMFRVEKKP